ncbi:hypothetical protein [Chitinophaga pinensis]|uniref:Uncharacterized protein n=1 Tax=Chitinophaga pinensis TaxID=79329 RepID=A0A5C6LLK1_9BACT|nr:hypothetical protein [Chitinophaga pinensis]TWV95633.1 hypothetical protein FEF09_24330 [Chitinophaga pinensis]
MKRALIAFLLLTTSFVVVQAQETTAEHQKLIAEFISNVKQQNKAALAEKVAFPLRRDAPIPPVKTKEEFLDRYNEIFDESLIKTIVNSKPDKDWSAMGWRGMMLEQGKVWLDGNGRLIAVNYQSTIEKRRQAALISADKKELDRSVRKYKRPVSLLETQKFRIRIDDIGKGQYRYSSWKLQSNVNETPDLIIDGGKVIFEGTGGNHYYEFENNGYIYKCVFTVLGEKDAAPVVVKITKDGKELLSQTATVIR